ncbi:MAG: uracil-DNA glycosylase family protein [Anaerolineales bacterium]|jgi:uracil-DNA glycosylase family 4
MPKNTLDIDLTAPDALQQLRARLDSCQLCLNAGHDIFPRAIYSGPQSARMMIIGQAPGITEKEAGRPFNAGSGTRLFQWLAMAGIREAWFRRTQYMTSVTKCYPGRTGSGSGDRVPSRAEQQLCRPYLDAERALVAPELILPVGRLAINLYFPASLRLDEVIGRQKQVGGSWVVPLPHPSGASRWHQIEANRKLVDQAVGLISAHVRRLFPMLPE